MNQTRLGSLIEGVVNLIVGGTVALLSQIVIFHAMDIPVSFVTNLWMTAYFTVISLARSYTLRRWFNARLHRGSHLLASKII